MAKKRGRMGLTLPTTEQTQSQRFGTFKLTDVQDWIKKLPRNNLGASAKFLYDLLLELNNTQLDSEHRHDVLEVLFPQVAIVNSALSENFIADDKFDYQQMMKVSRFMQALTLEMGYSYKLVIDETSSVFKRKKDLFLRCLHRLMLLNLECLQESYRMHTTPPKHLWQELHFIYRYAEKAKILGESVQHFDSRPIRHNTISHAYKHALLLACANPYRFSNHEYVNLNYGLESWACLLQVTPNAEQHTLFSVDLNSDSPPQLKHHDYASEKFVRYLDFNSILERLDQMIHHQHQKEAFQLEDLPVPNEFHLSLSTLRFLKNIWSQPSIRNHERIPNQGSLKATLGLKETFLAIAQNTGLTPTKQQALSLEQSNDEEIILEEVGKIQQSSGSAQSNSFDMYPVELIDISASGLGIEWSPPIPGKLKTGALIGFEANSESHGMLSIGVICWLKTQNNKTRSGVKILSSYAKPILCFPPNNMHPIKTLLLPPDPNAQPFTTLITPPLPFKEGMTVTITYQENIFEVFLKEDVASSSHFHVFHITSQDLEELAFLDFDQPTPIKELLSSIDFLENQ